jgi:hypothetical protein
MITKKTGVKNEDEDVTFILIWGGNIKIKK